MRAVPDELAGRHHLSSFVGCDAFEATVAHYAAWRSARTGCKADTLATTSRCRGIIEFPEANHMKAVLALSVSSLIVMVSLGAAPQQHQHETARPAGRLGKVHFAT